MFVFSSIVACSASIPDMGPCDVPICTQYDFDFDMFHRENGGCWHVAYGPDTSFNRNLSSMTINIDPIGNGQYRDIITYLTKDGKSGLLAEEVITNNGHGVCTATTTDDYKIDYRYVLAHRLLTADEKSAVYAIDKEYGFQGELIPFGISNQKDSI
ncbi:uncharacterized protein LOC128984136 isoform X2 [Macrosteles quadrilineatus]|uniref:uncharacterized protein LOC128984136 isoform X2 n=1 Tax=Macrosteles quadrilineatus TaxID=74068 RepID=UPI0023E2BD7E|nr:uncharacterized protein LOC128984136 isoform X2 [Macrosteles quadrilineatus]